MDDTAAPPHPLQGRVQRLMIVEAACAAIALIVVGLTIRGILPDISASVTDGAPFRPGMRPLVELSFTIPWLIVAYLVRQRRLELVAELEAWQPMHFDEPVRTEVSIRDFSGRRVRCSFEARAVLWFADDAALSEAELHRERIVDMVAELLKKAAGDATLRQSTGYLSDWVNDSLLIDGLARTELTASRFRVLPDGPPATPTQAANNDRPTSVVAG